MNLLKRFVYEEDGLGTVELVLILAALVSIALIFKKQIVSFVNDHVGGILTKRRPELRLKMVRRVRGKPHLNSVSLTYQADLVGCGCTIMPIDKEGQNVKTTEKQ